jgi:hypothetical protein
MNRPADTDPEAYEVQLEVYRHMSGGQRLALALELSDNVRTIAREGIQARHPNYSVREVADALNRLLLGDALFRAAWPGRPLLPP